MTRQVAWQRERSPFKSQRELVNTHFMGVHDSTAYRSQIKPDVTRQLFSMFLSPRCEITTDEYRDVLGQKARYVGCNIKGTLTCQGDFLIRIVQCIDPNYFGGSNVNVASSTWTSAFFKKTEHEDPEFGYRDLNDYTNQERLYAPINESKFKILKTKYITLPPSHNGTCHMGFHFYIPMNAMLEKDQEMTVLEFADNRTTNAMTTKSRRCYHKPIFLLIEPIMRTGDQYVCASTSSFCSMDLSVKHTFKDAI